jgi:hypothetical protein
VSRELIRAEAALLVREGSAVRCVDVGEQVAVILEPYTPPVPATFRPSTFAALLFLVPAAYKDAPPDPSGFYVQPADLRLGATNNLPRSTGSGQPIPGEPWLKFSWGLKGPQWDPEKDTLETYLATLERRLTRGD